MATRVSQSGLTPKQQAAQLAAQKVAIANAKQTVDNTTVRATPKQSAKQAQQVAGRVAPGPTLAPLPTQQPAAQQPAAAPSYYEPATPSLDAAQLQTFQQNYGKDESSIQTDQQSAGTAYTNWVNSTQQNALNTYNQTNTAQEAAAARGIMGSGVWSTNLADIQATSVINQNNYNSTYNTTMTKLAQNIGAMQADQSELIHGANNQMYENATTADGALLSNGGQIDPNAAQQMPDVASAYGSQYASPNTFNLQTQGQNPFQVGASDVSTQQQAVTPQYGANGFLNTAKPAGSTNATSGIGSVTPTTQGSAASGVTAAGSQTSALQAGTKNPLVKLPTPSNPTQNALASLAKTKVPTNG